MLTAIKIACTSLYRLNSVLSYELTAPNATDIRFLEELKKQVCKIPPFLQ